MNSINMAIYFVVPLLLTGLVHHLIVIPHNYFSFLVVPIDGELKLNGKSLLGKSKTWRGIIVVTVLNGIFSQVASLFISTPAGISVFPFIFGCLLGLGYSLAELPTSFIKRRLSIDPSQQGHGLVGKIFYLLDQSDSIIGSLIAANLLTSGITTNNNLVIGTIGVALHTAVDAFLHFRGYKTMLQKPELLKKLQRQALQKSK